MQPIHCTMNREMVQCIHCLVFRLSKLSENYVIDILFQEFPFSNRHPTSGGSGFCHFIRLPDELFGADDGCSLPGRQVAANRVPRRNYISDQGRLTVTKKNWALYFVMTILLWQFPNLKASARRAPICSSFCSHFSSTKMSSQSVFSTPKSIHIHKINSLIELFNSHVKWALIFSEKINLRVKSISALLFWWLLNGLQGGVSLAIVQN